MKDKYDHIILGSGASGLMLVYRMCSDPHFSDRSILIIDKDDKNTHDRTWCFWQEGNGEWDDILTHSWDTIQFVGDRFVSDIPMGDHRYKMIRSADFYSFVKSRLSGLVTFLKADIRSWSDTGTGARVETSAGTFHASTIFSSIMSPAMTPKDGSFAYLHQHFTGWFVRTKVPEFDPALATFMDFSISQKNNTRFMYVLPLSDHEALVEYTLFSKNLLPYGEYEEGIRDYLKVRGITEYDIIESEQGDIPMTCYPFWKHNSPQIMYIGSAGGWTKAATGYTFINIARYTDELVKFLRTHHDLSAFRFHGRHWYFDLIFLDVLHRNNALGKQIFTSIFKNNSIGTVLRFLDEKSTWAEDLAVLMNTSPKGSFITSAVKNLPLMIRSYLGK